MAIAGVLERMPCLTRGGRGASTMTRNDQPAFTTRDVKSPVSHTRPMGHRRAGAVAVGAVAAAICVAGCQDAGPSLVSAPGKAAGGHVALTSQQFDARQHMKLCRIVGKALVLPRATLADSSVTTAAEQVTATKSLMGFSPTPWTEVPGATRLIGCTWLSNATSDLKGLYVVKRGAGLRSTGTYVGTAVVDRSGQWTPDETISFDDYD
jgi:hypothetical protein